MVRAMGPRAAAHPRSRRASPPRGRPHRSRARRPAQPGARACPPRSRSRPLAAVPPRAKRCWWGGRRDRRGPGRDREGPDPRGTTCRRCRSCRRCLAVCLRVASPAGGASGPSSPRRSAVIPSGVAFTTRSMPSTSVGWPTRPTGPARAAAARPRSGVRFTTTTSRAPACDSASTTARPAPPAPTTRQRRPDGSNPCSDRSASRKPCPSVLSPISSSWRRTTVFTARRVVAVGEQRCSASATAVLWGMVTDRPSTPSAAAPASASRARPAGTGRAT